MIDRNCCRDDRLLDLAAHHAAGEETGKQHVVVGCLGPAVAMPRCGAIRQRRHQPELLATLRQQTASKRGITEDTVYTHLIKIDELGTPVDLDQFIESTEILKIQRAKKILENPESLKTYFEYFEHKIPYYKIKLALYLKK